MYNLGKFYKRKKEKELSGSQSCPHVEVATFFTSYCWYLGTNQMTAEECGEENLCIGNKTPEIERPA